MMDVNSEVPAQPAEPRLAHDRSWRSLITDRLANTGRLATNGGALIVNVIASGVGGFVFWIVVARNASTQSVAEATAFVATMTGVLQLSQQALIANVPNLIAAAPHPKGLAARAYLVSGGLTAVIAPAYVVVGPRVAGGLEYLRDPLLAVIFCLGTLMWSVFALQDAVLAGVRRGELVLAENTAWSLTRLAAVALLPTLGVGLSVVVVVSTWLIPALVLVIVVNYYLFASAAAPLRTPLGDHRYERRWLFSHLGFEQANAILAGVTRIILPAVVLTKLGSDDAASFMAALSFIVVSEGAISSFTSAFAVEVRRAGAATRPLLGLAVALLAAISIAAVVGARLFGEPVMGLFGSEYRVEGGAALAALALGIPLRCVGMLSTAVNRVYGSGWRSFLQGIAYSGVLIGLLFGLDLDRAVDLAWCLVAARLAAAGVAGLHLSHYLRRRIPIPGSQAARESIEGLDPTPADPSSDG